MLRYCKGSVSAEVAHGTHTIPTLAAPKKRTLSAKLACTYCTYTSAEQRKVAVLCTSVHSRPWLRYTERTPTSYFGRTGL